MGNMRYNRKSTSITISNFFEQYQLGKYRLDPPYQRDFNVWNGEQKSFLIDTILKNFPIPPIFLEQKINSDTGVTTYDVIDGKQRLSTIVDFINNKVSIPMSYGSDIYGNVELNGLFFNQIKEKAKIDDDIKAIVSDFWAYSLSVEYIENPDVKIVDNIFDRLNREGSRLNSQELRKAQYYDSLLYNDIEYYRNDSLMQKLTAKLNKNRMDDIGFITEIFLMTLCNGIIDGNESEIDKVFENEAEKYNAQKSSVTKDKFNKVGRLLQVWNIDLEKYHIEGVSHIYALWYIALYVVNERIEESDFIKQKLCAFYEDLRGGQQIEETIIYQQSMQSASRSKSSRKKRINAMLKYLGYKTI